MSTQNFYQSFLDNIYNKDIEFDERISDSKFRKFIIEKNGKTLETILMLKTSLSYALKKPQQLIYFDHDFYMANDMYTSTYYLCYKNLMMIDVDFDKIQTGIEWNQEIYLKFLQEFSEKNREFLFDIYKSRKGVHVFVIHEPFDYQQHSSIELMLKLKADFYYIIYSHLRGYCVRLNRKIGESAPIYQHIGKIGFGRPNTHLESLVKLHFNSIEMYSNHELSKMR